MMEDKIPKIVSIEICLVKAKACRYTTIKGEQEKKLFGVNKSAIKN